MENPPNACSAVEADHITYTYPGAPEPVLREATFTVSQGETFCLLGANGAGKTTLIRHLTGQLRPSSGRVLLFGREVRQGHNAGQLGVVPQDAGLFEGLTVEQHLRYFARLKLLRGAGAERAVARVIEEYGLTEKRGQRVATLSTGQQRRLLIALAVLSEPPLLILDEPTVGLDPTARRAVWSNIRRQRDLGKAIVLTTHYLEEAEHLADRVGFIRNGAIQVQGTLRELYAQIGKSVRVLEVDQADGHTISTTYFDNLSEAHEHAKAHALSSYSVGHISLEDIYFRLMGTRYQP